MIRSAAFEGKFYPSSKEAIFELIREVEDAGRYPDYPMNSGLVIGGVLPHAGHVYSAAQTIPFFRLLQERELVPDTIVILNPNHSGGGSRVEIDAHSYWKNSIGELEVDAKLSSLLSYEKNTQAQLFEHSAEVIIPYIQYYFQDKYPMILPVCLQCISAREAKALAFELYTAAQSLSRNCIVLASSDFSHFLSPKEGFKQDEKVLKKLREKDSEGLERVVLNDEISVCGYAPIMTLMEYASIVASSYEPKILARGHSGEVYPAREVVDYISILFKVEATMMLSTKEKRLLLDVADSAIRAYLLHGESVESKDVDIGEVGSIKCGVFVSVYVKGELRGCMGTFSESDYLLDNILRLSIDSAFEDKRFKPVAMHELGDLSIELSVLTPRKMIEDIREIEIGKHGIYLSYRNRSGTLLPQVAAKNEWTVVDFLECCCTNKMGLNKDAWKDAEIMTYEAIVFNNSPSSL